MTNLLVVVVTDSGRGRRSGKKHKKKPITTTVLVACPFVIMKWGRNDGYPYKQNLVKCANTECDAAGSDPLPETSTQKRIPLVRRLPIRNILKSRRVGRRPHVRFSGLCC
jgi:hypothetical protein